MATPKEQHDARPNARNTGPMHHRSAPVDAVSYAHRSEDVQPADPPRARPPEAAPARFGTPTPQHPDGG